MSAITFYLTYARKNSRSHWRLYGHDASRERAERLLSFAMPVGWETRIVPFIAEQSGSYDRFPDNVRTLPSEQADECPVCYGDPKACQYTDVHIGKGESAL